MSRSVGKIQRVGSRDFNIAWEAAQASLDEIESLVAIYDSGRWLSYRTLSVVIARLLFEEFRLIASHEDFEFISTSMGINTENLLDSFPLVAIRITNGYPNTVEFLSSNIDGNPPSLNRLSLTKWLDEAIYLESLSAYENRKGERPLKLKKSRYKLSRRNVIKRTRDEVGAHFDEAVSDVWAMLNSRPAGQDFLGIDQDGNIVSSSDRPDLFLFKNTIADASIRSIAGEVLLSLRTP